MAGARPNFMKIAPIMRALARDPRFDQRLVHTGQHYSAEMSDAFFRDLELPQPDVHLGIGSGTHAEQTARVMVEFERVIAEERPDLVIVVGDVNSTLACSLVTAKAQVRLAHVEAGLRSFDRSMPEEINRIVTDCLTDVFFTTSADADQNLRREGHEPERIHLVGNTMIDTLMRHRAAVDGEAWPAGVGVESGEYLLVTLHRPANVDEPHNLRLILQALRDAPLPVLFPIHPRTAAVAERAGLRSLLDTLHVMRPVGYLDFLRLQLHARLVLTDSGGIQEETTVLGVPCLTFRDNTERPVTVTHGTNRLIGTDPERILPEIRASLANPLPPGSIPPLWDGHAAERLVDCLAASL